MMWFVQLIVLLMTMLLSIVSQLVPALFQVFAWLMRYLFAILFQLTGRPLAHGALVLLSGGLWGGGALLIGSWLLVGLHYSFMPLFLGTAGGIWGLCVGHQAALLWRAEQLRRPDMDTQRLFDLPSDFFRSTTQKHNEQQTNDLFGSGIILGETEGEREK